MDYYINEWYHELMGQFNTSYIFTRFRASVVSSVTTQIRLFRSSRRSSSEKRKIRLCQVVCRVDPFASADSDSWTSRVMSSSLGSVVHVWEAVALDWSNSSVRLYEGNERDRDVESLESSVYTRFVSQTRVYD